MAADFDSLVAAENRLREHKPENSTRWQVLDNAAECLGSFVWKPS